MSSVGMAIGKGRKTAAPVERPGTAARRSRAPTLRLFHRLRYPLRAYRLAVIGHDRLKPSLLLQEVRLLRECLRRSSIRASSQPRGRRLLLEAREAVERHRVADVLGLAARPFG